MKKACIKQASGVFFSEHYKIRDVESLRKKLVNILKMAP